MTKGDENLRGRKCDVGVSMEGPSRCCGMGGLKALVLASSVEEDGVEIDGSSKAEKRVLGEESTGAGPGVRLT